MTIEHSPLPWQYDTENMRINDATDFKVGEMEALNDDLFVIRAVNSYEALRELSNKVAIFIAVKTDVDKDFNINHDNKNERRMWTAFDNLKTAQINAALALADEVKS